MQWINQPSWNEVLKDQKQKDYFKSLQEFVAKEYETQKIYPDKKDIFKALELTPFDQVKVVIIGQDPYHGEFQANGLSFSVSKGVKVPPSLANIFKEMEQDTGVRNLLNGDLSPWARQGVLLLNAILTVKQKSPGSHKDKGWEIFTDEIIAQISKKSSGVVFILWGSYAQKKGKDIDTSKHLVLSSVHPSPLSVYRGFYGSKPFSKANAYLKSVGKEPIDWKL